MDMNEQNETGLVEPAPVTPGRVPGTASIANITGTGEEQLFTTSRTNHRSPQKNPGASS